MNQLGAMSRNSTPRVSVLVPARDAATTLPACLRSIARQTWRDFECVVVDDGSTDATAAVVAATAARDARFQLHSRPAAGLVPTLQYGLAQCRGEFIARMDADDLMRADRLARQVELLQADPRLAAVGCHVRLFPRRALRPGRLDYEAWLNSLTSSAELRRDALVECPLAHPTWLARASALQGFGYRAVPWPKTTTCCCAGWRPASNSA
jgi:glycosyltransferase involved in cell wall biosynthesis